MLPNAEGITSLLHAVLCESVLPIMWMQLLQLDLLLHLLSSGLLVLVEVGCECERGLRQRCQAGTIALDACPPDARLSSSKWPNWPNKSATGTDTRFESLASE